MNDSINLNRSHVLSKKEMQNRKIPPIFKVNQPLRGLAILMVVLAHAVISMLTAEVSISQEGELLSLGFWLWELTSVWKSAILEICRASVPLFLFLSGYYMLSTKRTLKVIWVSSRKLLIPMITWSFVAWGYGWIKKSGGWTISTFIFKLFTGTTQLGYFFIILIIQYYILSVWLVRIIEKKPRESIICLCILQLCVHFFDYYYLLSRLSVLPRLGWLSFFGTFPEFLFPRFIVSFSLGIWASINNSFFKDIVIKRFKTVTIITFLTMLLLLFERGLIYGYSRYKLGLDYFTATSISWVEWKISTALWAIAFIFWIYGIFLRYIPFKKVLDLTGKYSFQIFLLHGMVVIIVEDIMYKYFSHLFFYGIFGTLVIFATSLILPLFFIRLTQKYFPPWLRVILLGS